VAGTPDPPDAGAPEPDATVVPEPTAPAAADGDPGPAGVVGTDDADGDDASVLDGPSLGGAAVADEESFVAAGPGERSRAGFKASGGRSETADMAVPNSSSPVPSVLSFFGLVRGSSGTTPTSRALLTGLTNRLPAWT
jgi:hypothetical protein